MLTQETKRKIDSARDILVGKVPDPKAQVEQITTALIYKFMDEMDKKSMALPKGKAQFFTNGFEKYAWNKLVDPKLGGHDRLELYVQAITRMSQNPHLPQLFRDIFKDTFLPYRNPETLTMFLKEINGFTYDHSEDLGDSFEYLLSVLGSQGDAGQFRTPRHIIDFIVAAVNPSKDDTVCDPACGTAGFLISAFKHILRQHDGKDDPDHKEKPLTPDQRKKLMNHFVGYDISPDMVRLSKVNMYLHGFPSPTIFEYDTLSSEERWDDSFDVMLANPPFMTPKGGIKPHKRFSVQANKSEVLFVDYILEHLRPNGRAGIIVPEGIVFQSGKAYKALRQSLVNDGLIAVVSLPSGVFNPYANVKTSILLFDNALRKLSSTLLFIKISNDGYDLGAQRKSIQENDIPRALDIFQRYRKSVSEGTRFELAKRESAFAQIVPRRKIADTAGHILTGDRYIKQNKSSQIKWPSVPLGDVCQLNPKKSEIADLSPNLEVSFIPMEDVSENSPRFVPRRTKKLSEVIKGYTYFRDGDVIVAKITPCFENGKAAVAMGLRNGIAFGSTEFWVLRPTERILSKLLYFYVSQRSFREHAVQRMTGSAGQRRVPRHVLENFEVPLPPLEVQRTMVNEIESKEQEIDAAKLLIQSLEAERDSVVAKYYAGQVKSKGV